MPIKLSPTPTATEPYSKTLADSASTSASDDEYTSRETIEQRILGQQVEPNESKQDELSSNFLDPTVRIGKRDLEDDDGTPQRKMGRAKAKRARKAAQNLATNISADAQVRPILSASF